MPKARDIPLGTYPAGTYSRGPFSIPNGFNGFSCAIGRCTDATPTLWPDPATLVTINVYSSFDAGATWYLSHALTNEPGGIKSNRNGQIAESKLTCGLDPAPNLVKVDIIVQGPAIRSYLDVTIL